MTERMTAISGSMFSGKTEALIRNITRAEIAGRSVQVFKPIIDDRWGKVEYIRSHAGAEHKAIPVTKAQDIFSYLEDGVNVVAIDEAQFFDDTIIPVVSELLERDIEVIFAGLPLDFRGEPFGHMPELLAMADKIDRLTAICTYKDNGEICGNDATRTQRIVNGKPANYSDPVIMIGADESYTARCPDHHFVPGKPATIYSAKDK